MNSYLTSTYKTPTASTMLNGLQNMNTAWSANPVGALIPFQSANPSLTNGLALGYNGRGLGGTSSNPNAWANMDFLGKANAIIGGLQGIGQLIGGFKQMKLAKQAFNLQKEQWDKTWDASKKAFNEGLETRSHNKFNGTDASRRNYDKYKLN